MLRARGCVGSSTRFFLQQYIGSCRKKVQSDFEKPSFQVKPRFLAQIILYMRKVVNPKIASYPSRAESCEPGISMGFLSGSTIRIFYGSSIALGSLSHSLIAQLIYSFFYLLSWGKMTFQASSNTNS